MRVGPNKHLIKDPNKEVTKEANKEVNKEPNKELISKLIRLAIKVNKVVLPFSLHFRVW